MRLNRQNSNTWTQNWSSRGTAMLNYMERKSDRITYTTPLMAEMKDSLAKLRFLLRTFPSNWFYKALAIQAANRKDFSPKQMRCIKSDYDKYSQQVMAANQL